MKSYFDETTVQYPAVFRNEGSSPINVYWIDFDGVEDTLPYYIAVGEQEIIDTANTYPYIFRNSPDDGKQLVASANGVSGEVYEGIKFGAQEGIDQIVVITDGGNIISIGFLPAVASNK